MEYCRLSHTDKDGVATTYDCLGASSALAIAPGRKKYTYAPCDRLIEIRQYGGETNGTALNGTDEELLCAQKHNRDNRACHVIRYRRNILDQVENITNALGHTEHYTYDPKGQLIQKLDKEGYLTKYAYTSQGDINHIAYADGREVRLGILDRYTYGYDLTGNKTAIEKQRRNLPQESGSYAYDALGRLSAVTRNSETLRTYEYDAFGNRSLLREGNAQTTYTYNAMNQIISRADALHEETYTYDKRGNLRLITENGALKNRYAYGALNRLEQAVNAQGAMQ